VEKGGGGGRGQSKARGDSWRGVGKEVEETRLKGNYLEREK